MSRTMYYILVGSVAIVLLMLNRSYSLGWLIGWVFIYLLVKWREKIHQSIDDLSQLSVKKYVGQLLFNLIIISIPLILSFVFPTQFNTLAVFSAFVCYRLLFFLTAT